jgi:hypothetical protein
MLQCDSLGNPLWDEDAQQWMVGNVSNTNIDMEASKDED